jgi:nucleoside-diphosphate-sugar epimerase
MVKLAEEIITMTNSKSKITFKPLPNDDPKQREPIIEKAEKILNWKPKTSRSDGLLKTIEYFKPLVVV